MIDKKYVFVARNPSKGTSFTQDEGFVFKATDKFVIPMLDAYITMLEVDGDVGSAQSESARLLRMRVHQFQIDNQNKVKVPDVDAGLEEETVLAPDVSVIEAPLVSNDVIIKIKRSLRDVHTIVEAQISNETDATKLIELRSIRNESVESLAAMGEKPSET